jgi:hypothetical protein
MPSQIAQSLSPSIGAFLLEQYGASASFGLLTLAALLNVALVGALWICARR